MTSATFDGFTGSIEVFSGCIGRDAVGTRGLNKRSRGSSVSTVSDYGLDGRDSIPDRGRGFSSYLCDHTRSGAHPASNTRGTGGKPRPGRDADHSPPSSAEVKKE
jgi:hypothetical protein